MQVSSGIIFYCSYNNLFFIIDNKTAFLLCHSSLFSKNSSDTEMNFNVEHLMYFYFGSFKMVS